MKQASYSLADFLTDPDFRDWVKHTTEAREAYWQQFQEAYPHQKPVIEQARQYIEVLTEQTSQHLPSATESQLMRQAIQARIREEEGIIPLNPPIKNSWWWVRIAASFTLIIGLGVLAYWYNQSRPRGPEGYSQFLRSTPPDATLTEIQNSASKPLTLSLKDGSSVVLQPGSRLSYSSKFTQRDVYLVGNAFFEVVKDPSNPFLVYTNGVATKVLGTSFSIDAPETNRSIKVAVKTGKVAVYSLNEATPINPNDTDLAQSGLVLTPNQSAEYLTDSHQIIRKIDSTSTFAQPGTLTVARQSFDFDETPVSEVFSTLEKAYGVDIIYDEAQLKNCSLSATLVGQPFHEKLSVICKALEAHYSLRGNQVVITGGQRCQ